MHCFIAAAAAVACCFQLALAQPLPSVALELDTQGAYNLLVNGDVWYQSAPASVCEFGSPAPLVFQASAPSNGIDAGLGPWAGTTATYATGNGTLLVATFKQFERLPSNVAISVAFPTGASVSCAGPLGTHFPAWDLTRGAKNLSALTWQGTALASTLVAPSLAALNPSGLDSGPIVSFPSDLTTSAAPPTSLVWSTLDNHKIISQSVSVTQTSSSYAVSALYSASRQDQIACVSDLCNADQQPNGNYTFQRVEGYGFTLSPSDAARGSVCANGALIKVAPLIFAYSATHDDNWIGSVSGPMTHQAPDGSYTFTGDNGAVIAEAGVPNTVPLQIYTKTFSGPSPRTDWAAVASPAGLAWAQSLGYKFQYTAGFVFPAAPVMCDSAQETSAVYAMGLTSLVKSIPVNWTHSVLFTVANGGPTAAVYAHGQVLKTAFNTTRLPSVTLSDVGYYTDDGAYYYVWEAFNIPARPWPAEVGLLLVKETLWAEGVPVAYMQLDDWWYNGNFYFGNVKSITDWHASNASRLFPSGLPKFSDALDLPLQLYAPFWADNFQTPFNMTESTVFKGTKLVTPADSYAFFSAFFDLGKQQTNGRFSAFEIDFLDSNFQGSSSMFETVYSADIWYKGLADAALERGIALQFCLPSVTDILESLMFPAVVQARASGDYVNVVDNAYEIGGSALIMGALSIAPSKDTLWTASPQPGTMSDTEHNGLSYTTQPHVTLDVALALLSMGPVGISDGLNQTDVPLISQAFRSAVDSTLLRPSRPVSWVDAYFVNKSLGLTASDVRSTHAAVPMQSDGEPTGQWHNSHAVLAWQTVTAVTLQPTDLYPSPDPAQSLLVRPHVFAGGAAAQLAGCTAGVAAVPNCAARVCAGCAVTLPPTGAKSLSNFSLTAVYEPYPNGAYLLGELTKIVPVSPQRFAYVYLGGAGPVGLVAGILGTAGEQIFLTAVDPTGIVRLTSVVIAACADSLPASPASAPAACLDIVEL